MTRSILKKPGRCNRCGNAIPAGAEIEWTSLEQPVRHPGNGTVLRYTQRWVPVHAKQIDCELAGVPGASRRRAALDILIGDARDTVAKLRKQRDGYLDDEDMLPTAQGQVDQAEKELDRLLQIQLEA